MAAIGEGYLRVIRVDKESNLDFIPVDLAVNQILAVAWYSASHRYENLKDDRIRVCNTNTFD